jgi:hypothetical protein
MQRWLTTIYYRTETGLVDVEQHFDELGDIQEWVERGPSFEAIDRIVINYQLGERAKTIAQTETE